MTEFAEQSSENADRRSSPRRRVLKSAMASFNGGHSTASCVMRDISESGAKLVFADLSYIPNSFALVVELDGYRIECERIWRSGQTCGVRFIGPKVPIRSLRSQTLKSSETSLSDRVLRELKLRDRATRVTERDPPVT